MDGLMVGIKWFRGATGRRSEWSTEDVSDPVNQIYLLHAFLDGASRSEAGRSLASAGVGMGAVILLAITGLVDEARRIPKADLRGTFFRARVADGDLPPDDFGPPVNQPRNRFNVVGGQALYCSRAESVLAAELSQDRAAEDFWVQRFVVENAGVLVRLDPVSSGEFRRVNELMILAERPRSNEPLDPYLGTQLLASVCVGLGLDAIEYPTVKGMYASDPSAVNVVVLTNAAIARVLGGRDGDPYRMHAT